MAKHETRYPEFQGWWKERLFRRRTISGEYFGIGKQEWYIAKLRGLYFGDDGPDPFVGVKMQGPSVPQVEVQGWRRAKIRDGFGYIRHKDMRAPMMAMILSEALPLPNAHDIARQCNMAWEQFVYDFAEGLYDMLKAKVGFRGI